MVTFKINFELFSLSVFVGDFEGHILPAHHSVPVPTTSRYAHAPLICSASGVESRLKNFGVYYTICKTNLVPIFF